MKKWTTRKTIILGLLIALHIVTGRLLSIELSPSLRITISSSFVMLAGLWFGPVAGALAGIVADILGSFIKGYSPFLPLTVTPMALGLLMGFFAPFLKKRKNILYYGICIIGSTLLASGVYSSFAFSLLYKAPMYIYLPGRLIQAAVTGVVNTIIVYTLYHCPAGKMVQ